MIYSFPSSKGAAAEMKAYASERGGDVRQLVVGGARVHALAEKWRVGRLLDPLAIRALLNKARGDDAAGAETFTRGIHGTRGRFTRLSFLGKGVDSAFINHMYLGGIHE